MKMTNIFTLALNLKKLYAPDILTTDTHSMKYSVITQENFYIFLFFFRNYSSRR